MRGLRIALVQINNTVGDFAGNTKKILDKVAEARSLGVDLVSFPELAICGYPPEDLLLKPRFIGENLHSLEQVIEKSAGITVVVGFVEADGDLYNAAAVIHDGRLAGVYRKIYLPNYGVFDENRYFRAGSDCQVYRICGVGVGINICEDIWYEAGPARVQSYTGAEVILNISSSPYHFGKGNLREKMLSARALDNMAVVAYNNLVGGQDELVFDGDSLVFDEKGELIARGKQFEEDLVVADLDIEAVFRARLHEPRWRKFVPFSQEQWQTSMIVVSGKEPVPKPPLPTREAKTYEPLAEVYRALVVGTRDYVGKNGFEKVLIGLSGGIDSGLVAALAVDALGASGVVGVLMPSGYSSPTSQSDAELLGKNLGIELMVIPIEDIFRTYLKVLAGHFEGTQSGVAEENLQARTRGNILMALSNKFGWLVLTTGNKSEMATGYATLYGDMAGGFAVLKDVPKTMVYNLARYRNSEAGYDLIPSSIIEKEPSAELRPGQLDIDSLPPYEQLDPILKAYVEEDKSIEQILAMGFNKDAVAKAARLVDFSEYKRRQAPPGIKITPRAFGRDRRLPITNWFKE